MKRSHGAQVLINETRGKKQESFAQTYIIFGKEMEIMDLDDIFVRTSKNVERKLKKKTNLVKALNIVIFIDTRIHTTVFRFQTNKNQPVPCNMSLKIYIHTKYKRVALYHLHFVAVYFMCNVHSQIMKFFFEQQQEEDFEHNRITTTIALQLEIW